MNRVLALAMVVTMGAGLVACSDDDSSDDAGSPKDGTILVTATDTNGEALAFSASASTAKAGTVNFTLKNTGSIEHEMVVFKTDVPFDQMPVEADGTVSEEGSIGEIAETEPGQSASASFDLEAGSYVLLCNIKDHYSAGMRLPLTVTG